MTYNGKKIEWDVFFVWVFGLIVDGLLLYAIGNFILGLFK